MEVNTDQFHKHLRDLAPHTGSFGWIFAMLKARAKSQGYFPSRTWHCLQKLSNPKKPYFIGTTRQGIKFLGDVRDEYSVAWMIFPDYDGVLIRFLQEQAEKSSGDFLDIGANMGVIAASVSKHMKGSRSVLAFEPMPATVKRAAATFALNGVENVRLFQAAANDQDGEMSVFSPVGHSDMVSAYNNDQIKSGTVLETKVTACTLDSLRGDLQRIGFLKLDVEGHELKVLHGAAQLINSDHPAILAEYNSNITPQAGWTINDFKAFIDSLGGYQYKVLRDDGSRGDLSAIDGNGFVNIHCEYQAKAH